MATKISKIKCLLGTLHYFDEKKNTHHLIKKGEIFNLPDSFLKGLKEGVDFVFVTQKPNDEPPTTETNNNTGSTQDLAKTEV